MLLRFRNSQIVTEPFPTPKRKVSREQSLAVHEAGHIFSEYCFGLIPQGATIDKIKEIQAIAGPHNGMVLQSINGYYSIVEYLAHKHGAVWSINKIMDYHAKFSFSGIVAQGYATGKLMPEEAREDFELLDIITSHFLPSYTDFQLRWDETCELIKDNFSMVEGIAKDLLKHRTLNEEFLYRKYLQVKNDINI